METPVIKADDKTYKAAKPKAKVWRLLVRFQDKYGEKPNILISEEAYDEALELMIALFNNKDVTVDFVEENLDCDEIFSKFYELQRWVEGTVIAKTDKMKGMSSKNAPATDSS